MDRVNNPVRANDNLWYCLATLYGEQPIGATVGSGDQQLSLRNRRAWNRWVSSAFTDDQRAELVESGTPQEELKPFSRDELLAFDRAFDLRTGHMLKSAPNPSEIADFSHTIFERPLILAGFVFAKGADFNSARFSESAFADFQSASFAGHAKFSSTTFGSYAVFKSVHILGRAEFASAIFSNYCFFEFGRFGSSVDFSSARFVNVADFSSATFVGISYFDSSIFFSRAFFRAAKFADNASFKSATFSEDADFVNAEFGVSTVFADMRLGNRVPDFGGAKLHEATEWHGVRWPAPPRDKDTAQLQVYAYERLKREMGRLEKYGDEQLFFRKELRARRELTPFAAGIWLLNFLYDIASDYGNSMGRPLFWLIELIAIGVVVFVASPVFGGAPLTLPNAAALSISNVFSFFPLSRGIVSPELIADLSEGARIVGAVQSVLGAILLFLLGLALRNRYRLR